MANGLEISVNQDEFMQKSEAERSWMLYEAITKIDKNGCRYSRGKYKKLYPIAAASGLIGGFLAALGLKGH